MFLVCLSVQSPVSGSRSLPCLWFQVLSGEGGTFFFDNYSKKDLFHEIEPNVKM